MGKDPAVLFYTSDFLSRTLTMSDEEVGKYIRLLCLQHQRGHLSEKEMLYICKTYVEAMYIHFKKDDTGKYYDEWFEEEILRRKSYCESRKNNITQRYIKSKDKSTYEPTYVQHMETETDTETGTKAKAKSLKDEDCQGEEIFKVWNEKMAWKITGLGAVRKKHLTERLMCPEFTKNFGLICDKILLSEFLSGKKPSAEHPNFRADFDWLIKNDLNWRKILEGKYDKLMDKYPSLKKWEIK